MPAAPDTYIPLYDGDDRTDRKILYHGNADGSHSPTAYLINPGDIGGAGGAYADHSGTIAAASTSQPCMPANASRRYLLIQNHGSADLWINAEGGSATGAQPSIRIPSGGNFEPIVAPRGAIAIFSSQQGLAYTAKEV
jgi:hypothetical protein